MPATDALQQSEEECMRSLLEEDGAHIEIRPLPKKMEDGAGWSEKKR